MITTTTPATTLATRVRRAAGTAALIPAFLVGLLLELFDQRWTWPRAIAVGAVCELAALALVLAAR